MNTRSDNTRSTVTIACALLLGLWAFAPAAQAEQTGNERVEICHFPPGNPANLHTITVSSSAVQKHIDKHGDVVGPCCDTDNCDDGNVCTANFCIDDACTSEPVECDDSVACTEDLCATEHGCVYEEDDSLCADGETCDENLGCIPDGPPQPVVCPCIEFWENVAEPSINTCGSGSSCDSIEGQVNLRCDTVPPNETFPPRYSAANKQPGRLECLVVLGTEAQGALPLVDDPEAALAACAAYHISICSPGR